MTNKIIFKFDAAPISTNRIWLQNYKTRHTYLNPDYKVFRQLVALTLRGTRMPNDWKFVDVKIVVHPKRRTGDPDNFIKAVLDSLTKAGFWEDDRVVASVSSSFGKPDKQGWTLVELTPTDSKFSDD